MADQRRYLLDSNVFIQACREYYGFDICPGFWTSILRQHQNHRLFSIDRVKSELLKGKDELAKWAKSKALGTFFKKTDDRAVVDWFGKMVVWVQGKSQYLQEAKAEFASVADGWLIAYAKVNRLIIVSQEVFSPDIRKKVPIPNVCRQFAVEPINTFEMLRELGIKFSLRKHG